MSNLLLDQDYIKFLKRCHPQFCIDTIENSCVPYYQTRINCIEALDSFWWSSLAKFLRCLSQNITNPKALVLGLPFEPYEQSSLLGMAPSVTKLVEMVKMAQGQILLITNVSSFDPRISRFSEEGFFALPSFPNTVADLTSYKCFFDYLSSLDPKNRQDLKRNLRTFEKAGHKLIDGKNCHNRFAPQAYEAYLHAYQGARVKWLKHSKKYLCDFFFACPHAVSTFAVDHQKRFLGFAHALKEQSRLHICRVAVAKKYVRRDAIYFRLMYWGIEKAIELGCQEVHLGPTAYRFKRRLNALQVPLVNLVMPMTATMRFLMLGNQRIHQNPLKHLTQSNKLEEKF